MSKEQNIKDIYSLAPLQYGLLYHWLMDKKSTAYFDQFDYTIKGDMDIDIWEKSVNILIDRYDILRTIFIDEGVKEPLQVVLKKRTLAIHYEDITHMGKKEEKDEYIIEYRQKDREKVPDLSRDMLLRIALFKTEAHQYRLIWSVHHIIMEAWCVELLYKEVYLVYRALTAGKEPQLPPAPPYKNFICWVEGQDKQEGLRYWREYLKDYQQPALVPKDVTGKQKGGKNQRQKYHFVFPHWLSAGLLKIARKNNVTLNTVIQVIWGIVLQRYNNLDDVVYGTVVSGRPPGIEGVETMVGLFINTIPARIKLGKEKYISQLMRQVQQQEGKSKSYEYLTLAEVQSCSDLKQNLIDHIIAFESRPVKLDKPMAEVQSCSDLKQNLNDHIMAFDGRPVKPDKPIESPGSSHFELVNMKSFTQFHYDFGFAIVPNDPLVIDFYFNSSAYTTGFIENVARHIKEVGKQIVEVPGIEIKDIRIISEEEKRQILEVFNNTGREYPREKTLDQLFTGQVKQVPDRIAVFGEANSGERPAKNAGTGKESIHLTYNHLNEKSDRLAHLLKEKGVKTESIAAIMGERSLEMLIGVLGILKAGAAYLLLDPDSPGDRVDYMLKDSGAKILLTVDEIFFLSTAGVFTPETVLNPHEGRPFTSHHSSSITHHSSNLAYIIYTSGTTGRPKGVSVQHQSVVNMIWSHRTVFGENPGSRISQVASSAFDAMVFEIWPCLSGGAVLCLADNETCMDPQRMKTWLIKNQITISFQSTLLAQKLLEEEWPKTVISLEMIRTAGDRLTCYPIIPYPFRFFNLYGPTEDTVWTTWTEVPVIPVEQENLQFPPIGKPVGNKQVYILNHDMKMQPVGVSGELCISGDGLARGYLNNPELTAEKFVICHLSSVISSSTFSPNDQWSMDNDRLYRTGDLAKWLQNGDILFLGRIDHQVKIRGFRIELGEIENQLLKHENIKEVVVIDREDERGDRHLNAYFVSDKELTVSELREALHSVLPTYMIPSYFTRVEKVPLTPNGKVDRKSLPVMQSIRPRLEAAYVAARTTVEKTIASFWKELLDVDEVGVNDNFFELGGNSNKIIQLRSRLKEIFPGDIPLTIFFEYPTIRLLANFFKQEQEAAKKAKVSPPTPNNEPIDRSPKIDEGKARLQQRLKQRR